MLIDSDEQEQKAQQQWTKELSVSAKRGSIVDRTGEILAQSGIGKSVLIRPKDVIFEGEEEPTSAAVDYVAGELARILQMDEETLREKCGNTNKGEIWLKRLITDEQAAEITDLGLEKLGVVLFVDTKRYYPYGDFLSQVIGYTNADGDGQEGTEKAFDKYLRGYDGTMLSLTDAESHSISGTEKVYIDSQDGCNVVLAVDTVIQSFAEQAAAEALEINKASGIGVLVMDPRTSDILAMVNYPEADLNDLPRNDAALLGQLSRNRTVTDAYEPGSTFKIITTASALDSGAAALSSEFDCVGYKIVDGERIKCWRSGNPHGHQTLTEAVENSCNPVFMQLALDMGIDKFYEYIYGFGFGARTGIKYSADGAGIVRAAKYVKNVDLARIGFGQSVAVTPLQLANAVCAVVNGGVLNTPRLVLGLTDSEGKSVEDYPVTQVRQIISSETSSQMRGILESVVENGSGANAKIAGYKVGGKTGTAQMYDEAGIASEVISSFICFAPADDPQYLVLFVVYEPQVAVTFGSVTAAPFAADILEKCLRYGNIDPEKGTDVPLVTVPDISGMTVKDAEISLSEKGLILDAEKEGTVRLQSPASGTEVKEGSAVAAVVVSASEEENNSVVVPDVVGKTVTEAYNTLKEAGLAMRTEEQRGASTVTRQTPEAQTRTEEGETVFVTVG